MLRRTISLLALALDLIWRRPSESSKTHTRSPLSLGLTLFRREGECLLLDTGDRYAVFTSTPWR
jgi:hypothetical protein